MAVVKRFVPFLLTEWQIVAKAFADYDSPELMFEAVQVITTWKLRFPAAFIPAAIQASEVLIQARLNDLAVNGSNLPGWIQESNNGYVIGLAITRFINFVNELGQTTTQQFTVRDSVDKFGIPQWIVELRHEAVHGIKYPPLTLLRDALQFCWTWLRNHYWNLSSETFVVGSTDLYGNPSWTIARRAKKNIGILFNRYYRRTQKAMSKKKANKKHEKADFEKCLTKLYSRYNDTVFEYLLNDNRFFLDDDSLKHWDWNLDENGLYPPPLFQQLWLPFFNSVKNCCDMSVFVKCLCAKILQSEQNSKPRKQFIAWLRFLIGEKLTDVAVGGNEWYRILILFLNDETFAEEQNLMNSIIDRASPLLTDHQSHLLKLLLNIKFPSSELKGIESILKEPLKDVPLVSEHLSNVTESCWELATVSYHWADCPIGLLPYQTSDTLDLRCSKINADRTVISLEDEHLSDSKTSATKEILLDGNEINPISNGCESKVEEIWIN